MQVALALVLLVASGLMIRTFQALRDVDPGFTDPEQIQTLHLSISQATVPEFDRVIRMQNEICDTAFRHCRSGIGRLLVTESAVDRQRPEWPVLARGQAGGGAARDRVSVHVAELLRVRWARRLVAGRDFQWTDHYGTRQVAIVSETVARREWGSPAAAIGKRMRRSEKSPWLEVVGVAGDVRHHGLDQPAPDTVYLTVERGRWRRT